MLRVTATLSLVLFLAACTAAPIYQTYASAFGNYDEVFDATVTVLDQYSLLRVVDRDTGLVVGEMMPDNRFVDPTRREIIARIHKRANYNDVEVRVIYSIEDGQLSVHGGVPNYQWRRVDLDDRLQQQLTTEIKERLSGDAWVGKSNPSIPPAAAPEPPSLADEISATDAEIIQVIQTRRVTLDFDERPLDEVFDFIRDITGLNVVLARSAQDAVANGGASITLKVEDVLLEEALDLMRLASTAPFEVRVRSGALVVSAPVSEVR